MKRVLAVGLSLALIATLCSCSAEDSETAEAAKTWLTREDITVNEDLSNSIFPEGMENGPPRFAIDRRNRWMIDQADHVICYVQKTWGGAYNYVRLARKKGKVIHNLGKVQF